MYVTVVTPYKDINEEIPEDLSNYEKYLYVCERYFDDITDFIDNYDAAFNWLLEGTYRINY